MTAIKKILVPIDFTPYSDRAVEVATQMARQFRARMILLHVIEQFTYTVLERFYHFHYTHYQSLVLSH